MSFLEFTNRATRFMRMGAIVLLVALTLSLPTHAAVQWRRVGTVNGTLTNGQICYTNGQDILCDTNAPTLSGTNLGIGTTSPNNALTVNGTVGYMLGTDLTTTGSQNDVAIGMTSAIRYNGAATATFTGIAAGANGQILYLHNPSAYTLTLSNQSVSSAAANRIVTGTGANLSVPANTSVSLQYDGTAALWRVTGSSNSANTLAAGTTGQVQFNGGTNLAADSNFTWDNTNKRLGIGTMSPANTLSLGGGSAQTLWMERNPTANSAGNNLTVQAGGATSGSTDKNGGNLILASGVSVGSAASSILFKISRGATSSSTDDAFGTVGTITDYDQSGGFGCNPGSPCAHLTVAAGGGENGVITVQSSGNTGAAFNLKSDNTNGYVYRGLTGLDLTNTQHFYIGQWGDPENTLNFYLGTNLSAAGRIMSMTTSGVGIGSISPISALDISQKTDAVALPVGTTGQRPTGTNGMVRYNSTLAALEGYINGGWTSLLSSGALSSGITLGTSAAVTNPQVSGDATTGLYSDAVGTVEIASSGTKTFSSSSTKTLIPVGSVGIGTAAPAKTLDVVGTGKFSTSLVTPLIYPATDSASAIQFDKADGATNVMTIDTINGRVGVGSSAPGSLLHIAVSDASTYASSSGAATGPTGTATMVISNESFTAGSGAYLQFQTFNSGGWGPQQGSYIGAVSSNTAYAASLVFGGRSGVSSYAERMRIDNNTGNVGIGTANPGAMLHIVTSSGRALRLDTPSASNSAVEFYQSGSYKWGVYNPSNRSDLRFYDGIADRLTIQNGGNVGIGTTSPGSKLQLNGSAAIGYATSTAAPTNGLAVSGSVAVGTTTVPANVTASINGIVQVAGTGSEPCTSAQIGSMRYNPIGQYMEICTYP